MGKPTINEVTNIHEQSQAIIKINLWKALNRENVPENSTDSIIEQIFADARLINSNVNGEMSSNHKCKKYFKNNFTYVAQQEIELGENQYAKKSFCHYVPIKSSII